MNWHFDEGTKWSIEGHCATLNDHYVAYTTGQNGHIIYLRGNQDPDQPCVTLIGHHRTVRAMAISSRQSPCWLVSVGEDHVTLWNIDLCISNYEEGEEVVGVELCSGLQGISFASLSCECTYVACCAGAQVIVLSTQTINSSPDTTILLEGHSADVTRAGFVPDADSNEATLLISISEDRTFKVWHFRESQLLYQSAILCAQPLTALAFHPDETLVALGNSEGKLFFFDIANPRSCREMSKLDVVKLTKRLLGTDSTSMKTSVSSSSLPNRGDELGIAVSCEAASSILALHYFGWWAERKDAHIPLDNFAVSDLREALCSQVHLIVATITGLFVLNAKTLDLEAETTYSDLEIDDAIGSATLVTSSPSEITLCLSDVNNARIFVNSIVPYQKDGDGDDTGGINVVARSPLTEDSVLRSTLAPKSPARKGKRPSKQAVGAHAGPGSLDKKGRIVDKQPVVFRKTIKSSGYACFEPKRQPFQPNLSRHHQTTVFTQPKAGGKQSVKSLAQSYPIDADIPKEKTKHACMDVKPVIITNLSFSCNGSMLACSLGNHSCQLVNPGNLKSRCSLIGHNGRVTWCAWSHDDQWILTSSDDKTARIWNTATGELAMCVDSPMGNMKDENGKPGKNNTNFKEINNAQFFFVDRFFFLTSENNFSLYKYHLETEKSDIKRYKSNSKYKLVKSFPFNSFNRITAVAGVNRFYSYLVFCAGSDKSFSILDVNEGRVVQQNVDCHTRNIDYIAQNQGSNYSSLSSEGYDIYATSATGDGIKLWDLRTNKSIQRYQSHVNRVAPIGVEFSPCGRYLACGSEDRSAYIYDIRATTAFSRLSGHSDSVATVAFHPLKPGLFTGTVDGYVSIFRTSGDN